MAKTIKFNLILDEHPVRTLEGLQEHFSVEDLLKYYKNGLLLRWLKVREYKKQYEAVKAIQAESDAMAVIIELIKIFEIEIEEGYGSIEQELRILSYQEEEKEMLAEYKKTRIEKEQIIDDYLSGYSKLITHMIENKENMALLKADTIQLEKEYIGLFAINCTALYFRLVKTAPKAIFAILTRDALRHWWIGETSEPDVYKHIKANLLSPSQLKKLLGEDFKVVKKGNRDIWPPSEWRPIECPETEIMVLHIDGGIFIRNAGAFYEELRAGDVNGTLIKLKGLECQCPYNDRELIYMEV